MKSLIAVSLLCGLLALAGCGATMVMTQNRLTEDGEKWGVVKYSTSGADMVVNRRRADARKKMTRFCFPEPYKIVTVSPGSSLLFYEGSGGSMSSVHIKFVCVKPQ